MNRNLADIPLNRSWSWVSGRNITPDRGAVDITRGEVGVEEVEGGEEVGVEEVVVDGVIRRLG